MVHGNLILTLITNITKKKGSELTIIHVYSVPRLILEITVKHNLKIKTSDKNVAFERWTAFISYNEHTECKNRFELEGEVNSSTIRLYYRWELFACFSEP